MQRLEVSGGVRPIYRSLGFKGLIQKNYDKKRNGLVGNEDCLTLLPNAATIPSCGFFPPPLLVHSPLIFNVKML